MLRSMSVPGSLPGSLTDPVPFRSTGTGIVRPWMERARLAAAPSIRTYATGACISPWEPPPSFVSRPFGAAREPYEGMGKEAAMADVAYCMKCREKREFTGSLTTLANGRPALQGTCPVCGTKLTKILGMDAAKAMGWKAP